MDETEQSYETRERVWDEQWPVRPTGSTAHSGREPDVEDELTPFPGEVGTDDPIVAAEEAEPYMPPIDPPVLPGGRDGIHVATGFGVSTEEEAAEAGEPRGDEDIRDQAILTLQQDSLTSHYPLHVQVRDGVVRLTGTVPSIDDADHAMSILSELPGVVDVLDETTLDPTFVG